MTCLAMKSDIGLVIEERKNSVIAAGIWYGNIVACNNDDNINSSPFHLSNSLSFVRSSILSGTP